MDQNDYASLLSDATERRDELAAEPEKNPYVDILQKDDEEQNQKIMNSLFSVGGINPDQAAEAQKLGLDLGVGPDVARRNMDDLRKRAALMKAQEYKLTASSPVLARQLTDPEFAAIAQDDLERLTGTEKTLQTIKNAGGSVAAGFLGADAGVAGAFRMGAELYGQVSDYTAGALGFDTSGDNAAQSAAKWLQGFQARRNESAASYRPDLSRSGIIERGIYGGIESGTQMIATLPTLLGGPEAYLAANVGIVTGQEYDKARNKGLSPGRSSVYALGQGAVEYLTERIPVIKLMEDLGGNSGFAKTLMRQIASEVPTEVVATVWQNFNEWVQLNPEKPVSAFLAEQPSAVAETIIATIVATGANTTVIKGAEQVFNRIDRAGADAYRANLMSEQLQRLTDMATASKLRQRNPAAYQKYVATQTEGTPIENLYIDAEQMVEVLNQSNLTNGELDAMLPGLREQLTAAVLPGGNVAGDIVIPTAQYAAAVAGTDLGNAMMPHVRMGEQAMSQTEAEQFEGQKQQMIAEAAQVMDQKRETDKVFIDSASEVQKTLYEQLVATGVYTKEQSKNAAVLQSATYITLASQMGLTPSQVYELMPYRQVAGQAGQAGQAAGQRPTMATMATTATAPAPTAAAPSTFADMVQPFPGEGYRVGPISFAFYHRGRDRYIRVLDRSGNNLLQAADGAEPGVDVTDVWSAEDPNQIEPRQGNKVGINSLENNVPSQFATVFREWLEGKIDENEAVARIKATERSSLPSETDSLNQAAAPLTDEQLEPVVNAASLDSSNTLSKSQAWQKGRDLKIAIQDRVLAALRALKLDPSVRSPAAIKYLVKVGAKDALAALAQNPNAIGWYDVKTRQALAVMSLVHPEIMTDPNARFAFTWALAVTSNGIKVGKNFELADQVYRRFKAEGRMPTDIQAGQAQIAINESLRLFNELANDWGMENLRQFMLTDFKVSEISGINKDLTPSGEFSDTMVRGAAILGPKIGNGFFSNLYGVFDALTMDRWLVRTWGRWTGTLIEIDPQQVAGARDVLRNMAAEVDIAELANRLRAVTKTTKKKGETEVKPADRERLIKALEAGWDTEEQVDELAFAVQKASQEPKFRTVMNEVPGGRELRTKGNNLAKYLDGQKEQPAGPAERNYIREVFQGILDELKDGNEEYAGLTMADLQAVLWYAEKRLYETAKEDSVVADDVADGAVSGYEDEEAPDYANAAAAQARADGVPDETIKATLKKEAERGSAEGTGAADQPGAGGSQADVSGGQGGGTQAARGFTRGQKRSFIQRSAIHRIRSNRIGDAAASWSYARASGEDGGKPRLLKKLGVRHVGEWKAGQKLRTVFKANGISTPTIYELEAGNPQNAERFIAAIEGARASLGAIGEAVKVYPTSDYAGMRLFMAEDGNAGFALKEDGDIISVFSSKGTGAGRAIMETAIAAGGRKLDAFDTILPDFYAVHGFKGTSRLAWNDEIAMADMPSWDKQAFAEFNGGEPDVVFMAYDPDHMGGYDQDTTPLMEGDDAYDEAVSAQTDAVQQVAARRVSTGGTLFQAAPNGPRGGYSPQQLTTILNESSDVSTVMHEFSHFYLDVLTRLISHPSATPQMKADLQAMVEFSGATMDQWSAWTAEYEATGKIPEGMRKVHEAVAYNTEIYLFEGKAPSLELQGAFERFVRWMKQVYINIRDQLNAAYRQEFGEDLPVLTGEVRQVFDRMLASGEEIKQAQAVRNMMPVFGSQAESGMSPEEWTAYQAMLEEARDAAVTDLTKASLRQMQWLSNARGRLLKEMQRKHEARRKEIRKEVSEEIAKRPLYQAIEFLKRGKIDGVEVEYPVKLSIEEIEAMYGENPIVGLIKKSLGFGKFGMLASENAIHPDQVAEMFGFASGDAMVRELLAAPSLREAVNTETDARMLAENGDLNTPEAKEAAIEAALHNEARARFVAVELRFLEKATQPVRVMLKAAQQIARETIARKVIKEIRPREFSVAEGRAAKKAIDAMKAGDSKGAARAKQAQLLQNQLAAEAIAAREEIKAALTSFRNLFKADNKIAKGRNIDLVNAARSILAAYGIGKADKPPVEYTQQLRAYNPELYAELEPLILRASAGAKPYDTLTMDEFRLVRDAVDALWYQARRDNQVMVEGRKMSLETVIGELNTRLTDIGIPPEVPGEREAVGKKDKLVRSFFQGKALIRRVEHWASATDGPGGTGPFTKYIWRPMRKAIDAYRTERNVYVKRYVELLQGVDLPARKIAAPELGYTFGNANGGIGKAEVLGAIMHTGNESNLRKLLLGRGWARELGDGTIDTTRWDAFRLRMISEGVITKADMDFIQAVWDLNEELKPQAQRAHHDLFGYYFKEVQPTPVTTPWGVYRGGYVPAKVDPDMVRDAQVHQKMEDMEADFRNSMPSTGMGFTKGRVEYNKPLSLDVRLIAKHIDDVIRFAHVQPVVKDVVRILRQRELADNLTRLDPTAIEGMLLPWLNRAARQITMEAGKHKAVDKFWSAVRSRTGIGIMFANITNALQQVTGYFPALLKVKPTYLKSALVQYMGGLQKMTEDVAAASPFMADRLNNQVFDLQDTMNDLLLNPSRYNKIQKWAGHHGYFLQQAFQNQVDVVTWTATFNQTLAELGADRTDDEAVREAVARADANVRMTQSSLMPEDISAFEVGSPFYKTLIQFSGYFNMIANLNTDEYVKVFRDLGWRGNKGKLFMIYLLGFGLPMLISDAIVRSLGGQWDDDDEDGYLDVFMSWFFGSQARGAIALIPAFGPGIASIGNAFNNKPYDDRMTTSPSISTLEAVTIGVAQTAINIVDPDKDVTGKNVRDVLTLISLVTGIPVTVLGRPIGYQIDVSRDKIEPTSTADYLRGLATGKASAASRP
jgi:hypothetical protein